VKITRSSKCSFKFATKAKHDLLQGVLTEYGKIVNQFIEHFWVAPKLPSKGELLKPIVDLPGDTTWLSARLRKVAAREALDMILAARKRWHDKAVKPTHKGKRMAVSSTIARLETAKEATEFDAWLILRSIGDKVNLDLPIQFHRHFNRLSARGKRLEAFVITDHDVQFAFEIETGIKRTTGINLGIDTGILALASLSDGRQLGLDTKPLVERIKRCQHGSKGQQRARRALKQRMNEVAKEVTSTSDLRLIVVEQLSNLNHKTKVKRRLTKTMRRSLGAWAYRYWLGRVESRCEDNRVVFRSVNPAYTSQRCQACGHTERGNRSGEVFRCQSCGHTGNADLNAARNILDRFLTGPYGADFKPKNLSVSA
jgi:putative transposase